MIALLGLYLIFHGEILRKKPPKITDCYDRFSNKIIGEKCEYREGDLEIMAGGIIFVLGGFLGGFSIVMSFIPKSMI